MSVAELAASDNDKRPTTWCNEGTYRLGPGPLRQIGQKIGQ